MGKNYSTSFASDEHYHSAALENAVQIKNAAGLAVPARNVCGIYITNHSNNQVWVLISDAPPGANSHALATYTGTLYPVAAMPGDLAIGLHGGEEFQNGIWIGAYSTDALAIAGGAPDAGNILLVKCDFTAAKYTPNNSW